MLKVPGSIPRLLFHFLTSLLQRRKLCSKPLFHFFFTSVSRACHREEKLCSWLLLDHGFQEDNALEGYHVKGQNWSWLPRDLHWMEDNHSGRNTCRGS
jgi:hypothetical protein